jgi:hypothetical protein
MDKMWNGKSCIECAKDCAMCDPEGKCKKCKDGKRCHLRCDLYDYEVANGCVEECVLPWGVESNVPHLGLGLPQCQYGEIEVMRLGPGVPCPAGWVFRSDKGCLR